ncbi:MAG: ECF transporter S component [Spirochaetaceae bacterium 4572_59]|nr:MAG: ECF transporter S component [Spirochaetaceae bacterium 4572_59]
MSNTNRTRKIVITGVMSAISVVLGATHLGFIPWFSGASLTIMHVPVIIGAILEGPVVGMIIGLIFGLFSLLQAAVSPTGPVDLFFTNPLVSVLPRILIGLTTWLIYRAFRDRWLPLAVVSAPLVGSLTNTALVLGALGVAKALPWELIGTIMIANGLPEAGAAAMISISVIVTWKSIGLKKKSKLDELDED